MKSLADILKNRPSRQVFNPQTDKPFDQTEGGSPPYPFPPELVRELAGKSEAEVSSLLSKFRTGLSEHRTRASEHRTDLSEHRTDLFGYRSELSSERTDLSQHRTELSEHRTALSESRSLLSNERTHLGYLRTGVSLISFGITINRFAIFLMQNKTAGADQPQGRPLLLHMWSTEQLGLGMVALGVLVLLWSLYRYRRVNQQILLKRLKPQRISTTMVTLAVVLFGALTTIVLMVT